MRAFKEGDELKFNSVTNDNFVCKDCQYRDDNNISECEWFDVKPSKVLNGGACKVYEKD